jgi:hypothetical protein
MLLLYSFVFKIIDHHLKLNISMYYLTILIRVHPCNIRSALLPTKNMNVDVENVLSDPIRFQP